MKNLKLVLLVISIFAFSIILVSRPLSKGYSEYSVFQQDVDTNVWVAPESANELVNPIEVDDDNLAEGKSLYSRNCRSCHGKLGDGTGAGGQELTTKPSDFTKAEFKKQTDGSIFWKITNGRNDMESYSEKLSEEEIWSIINYIKTLAP